MVLNSYPLRCRSRCATAALLALALVAPGCSLWGGASAPGDSATAAPASGGIGSFFSGFSGRSRQGVTGAAAEVNCPPADVRRGASTLTIGSGGTTTAMTVKYQGTFTNVARQCSVSGDAMVMKVGVQGRVVVGPVGGPGQVDVPLRIAVVQDTPGGMRPIVTKFIRVPVTIGGGEGNVIFTYVEEALTFPLPTPITQLDDYTVYVGFDPQTAQAQEQIKAPPKSKGRSRSRLAPATH